MGNAEWGVGPAPRQSLQWDDRGGACALTTCIVWNKVGLQVTPGNSVRFSDVQGGYAGAGNLSTDPLFASPAGLNFQLTEPSPCIGTGTLAGVAHDILNVPRPLGSAPDLGAYEFVPEPACALLLVLVGLVGRVGR